MLQRTRWVQLGLGVICMIAISSPQYVWTLFTKPLTTTIGASLVEIQVTFSILIVVQTFLAPTQGFLVDRFGSRILLSTGAVLTGLSWMLASRASGVLELYLTYGLLGGLGTGIIYIGVVGHVVRWFPDKRGLATGLVAAGYGIGAILTTFPITKVMDASSYREVLWQFGLIFALVGGLAAQGFRRPTQAEQKSLAMTFGQDRSRSVTSRQMLRTSIFWLMFLMMTMMSTSGLMVISQMGAFTTDFGLADALVFGLPVLPLALSLDRITNGLTRPFFGWVSDRVGRENTMAIAFGLEGAAMTIWLLTRHNPTVFVLMSGVVFFGWGEIFSLFPSTLTDTFGPRHATSNYGFLYISQGLGSVLGGPLAALLHAAADSWLPVFQVIIAMDAATALLAYFVLKPARRRWLEQARSSIPAERPGEPERSSAAIVPAPL